ncbi:MAG TPA: sulfite oxidase [Thermoplasmata archaeon]|nr:sulfite oxidase [Thermoplasmata archaeon]
MPSGNLGAHCFEARLDAAAQPITPTRDFFVRSHFAVPQIRRNEWRLSVGGTVDRPFDLDYNDLQALPHRELEVTVECAGNSRSSVRPKTEGVPWGHGAVSTARWRGVPLAIVLEQAGVSSRAREVVFRGADHGREPGLAGELHFEMSVGIEKALDPDTLLVDEMNGQPLAPAHGFPVRALVPGYYGMASVKWLTDVHVIDRPFQGYFRTQEYVYIPGERHGQTSPIPATVIRVKSLVTWPLEGQVLGSGPHSIRGIAWSGASPVVRVEVSVSPASAPGENWRLARLDPPTSRYALAEWELPFTFDEAGAYTIHVRATDESGNDQPSVAEWNLRGIGNNSIHSVSITVAPSRARASESLPNRPAA